MTREENSKVAFKWHYGKNPNRTVEKQTNKQNKGQKKDLQIFRKRRVTSVYDFRRRNEEWRPSIYSKLYNLMVKGDYMSNA